MNGARVIARSWVDDDFRTLLKLDAIGAFQALGLPVREGYQLVAVFNSQTVHNLLVCTLSWDKKHRVVAKVEWHPGELYPCVGFIVTNLSRKAERVVAFYNHRGTAELGEVLYLLDKLYGVHPVDAIQNPRMA